MNSACLKVKAPSAAAVILLALCVVFALHAWHYAYVSDDAFISLRYARNFAQGNGLVYNRGERVEGFTSLLWTVALGGAGYLGFDLLATARVLGVAAGIVTILLTYRLCRRIQGAEADKRWGLIAPLILALNGPFACWAASGLETCLFVCLIVGAFLAAVADRYWASAWLSAACVLVRPEGVLIIAGLGAYRLYRHARDATSPWLGWLLVCGAVLALVTVFRLLYFGDVLPNTYYAKTGGSWRQIQRGLAYLDEYVADHEGLTLTVAVAVAALVMGNTGIRSACVGIAVLWAGVIAVGGDGLPMYRFALSALPLALVVEATVLRDVYNACAKHSLFRPGAAAMVVIALVGATAVAHVSPPIVGRHYALYSYQKHVEIPRWTRVGQWFEANAAEGESLATVPIGAVGYYSGLRVHDMLGLTDKHIARQRPPRMGEGWAGHEKHDGAYILSRRPTYLLLGNIDVTPRPRKLNAQPFIPYTDANIWAREKDIYADGRLFELYQPRCVQLGTNAYLNFYELKREFRKTRAQ